MIRWGSAALRSQQSGQFVPHLQIFATKTFEGCSTNLLCQLCVSKDTPTLTLTVPLAIVPLPLGLFRALQGWRDTRPATVLQPRSTYVLKFVSSCLASTRSRSPMHLNTRTEASSSGLGPLRQVVRQVVRSEQHLRRPQHPHRGFPGLTAEPCN